MTFICVYYKYENFITIYNTHVAHLQIDFMYIYIADDGGNDGHHHFGYKKTEDWSNHFPICSGPRQSPINIDLQQVDSLSSKKSKLRALNLENRPVKMTMVNNGHTGKIYIV